jgi:hypothetical protein
MPAHRLSLRDVYGPSSPGIILQHIMWPANAPDAQVTIIRVTMEPGAVSRMRHRCELCSTASSQPSLEPGREGFRGHPAETDHWTLAATPSLKLHEASGHVEIVDQVPDRNAELCEFLIDLLRILDDFGLLSLGVLLAHRFTVLQ